MSEQAPGPGPAAPSDAEFLDPAASRGALLRLCHHHALIAVRRELTTRAHLSVILAVDAARHRLLLDALQPDPVPPLQAGETLRCRSRLEGAEAAFSAEFVAGETWEDAPALALRLPETVRLRERRDARRLGLPDTVERPPSRIAVDGRVEPAQVLDVSLLGAGISTDARVGIAIGDTVQLELELPDAHVLTLAEVRTLAARGLTQRLGLRFTRIAPRDLDRLAAALLRLERQLIRESRPR